MDASDLHDFNSLQEFVLDACPSAWLNYAEELRDSAELIWSRDKDMRCIESSLDSHQRVIEVTAISPVSRTYILLAVFALENLLKGHLVLANPSLVNQGILSNELKSHDIVGLAARIPSLRLSDQERRFCDIATKAIPYWGRYPIPLKKSQVLPEVAVDEALRLAFVGLFQRLAHSLYFAVRDGWNSGVGPKTVRLRSVRYGDDIDLRESLL